MSAPTIRPIETTYKGYRFRSRLEARWAVAFNHLGIPWQYEPQGYVIDGTPYLPDFCLTDDEVWVEVRGDQARLDADIARLRAAAAHRPVLILGPIPPEASQPRVFVHPLLGVRGVSYVQLMSRTKCWTGHCDRWHVLLPLPLADVDGRTPRLAGNSRYARRWVEAAYQQARTARFEHGETP